MKKSARHQSRHRQVAERLRQEILERGVVGERLMSEPELADRHDVSINTMREALRSLEQTGWLDRRRGSGTYVADPVSSREVAVVMELDMAHPRVSRFYLRLTQALRRYLDEQGARPRLYMGTLPPEDPTGEFTCRDFLRDLEAGRLCGVGYVYAPWGPAAQQFADQAAVPAVALWPGMFRNRVELDYAAMLREGTRFFLERDRRRIAVVGWGTGNDNTSRAGVREQVRRILGEAGVAIPEEWLRLEFHPNLPGAGWEEFRELWSGRTEKPDGLLVLDDMLLPGVVRALGEAQVRVPAELLVISHANKGSPSVAPFPLPRMEFDPEECAQAMGAMLLQLIRRQQPEPLVRKISFHWQNQSGVATPSAIEVLPAKAEGVGS